MNKFILFLIPVCFACTNITIADLTNSEMLLQQSECIYIIDTNTTINVMDYKTNDIINMTPYSIATNTVQNRQYVCDYDKLNLNLSLPFSGSYSELNHNITITAPTQPTINAERNLSHGETYLNSQYNLTVNCEPPPKINEILNLTAGTSKTYDNYNLTINALHYKFNISKNLSLGGSVNFEQPNITIFSDTLEKYNQSITLECGEKKEWPELGLTVNSIECVNANVKIEYGMNYSYPQCKLNLSASEKLNYNKQLDANEAFTNELLGINLSCQPSNQTYYEYCRSIESGKISDWTELNPENCTTYGIVCLDWVTNDCTTEEKFQIGGHGLIACYNRNIGEMKANTSQLESDLTICNTERNKLASTSENYMQGSSQIAEAIIWGIAGFVFITALALAAHYFISKKLNEGAT